MINFFNFPTIDTNYSKTNNTFFVTEEALYEFDNTDAYLIIKIKKENLSTWEMTQIISEYIGIKIKDIGYCGLKDKDATTIQFVSINSSYEEKIKNFKHKQIKILDIKKHSTKLKIGHLKGNHFEIVFNDKSIFDELSKRVEKISSLGMPNYFGEQRFGKDEKNYIIGKEIIEGKNKRFPKHKSKLFISAYQSFLFNNWLDERINISKQINTQKHPFKILEGDVFLHYPYGKIFSSDDLQNECERFYNKDISITGLLAGQKATKATQQAYEIEKKIDVINKQTSSLPTKQIQGSRRYAWVFPRDLNLEIIDESVHLKFFLPKGSYATILLQQLGISIKD